MRKAMQVMTLLVALAVAGLAQPRDFAPGTRYDGSIPTMKQVLGHEPGERVTTPEQIGLYLRALHAAAPDRTRLIRYGESWEGRELHALIVGGVERMRQLEEVPIRCSASCRWWWPCSTVFMAMRSLRARRPWSRPGTSLPPRVIRWST